METNESNNVNSTCVEVKEATKINMLMYTGGGAVIYDSLYVVRNATIFEATCKFCEMHGLEAPRCEDNIITEVAGFSEPKLWIYDERNGTWIPEEANASLIVSQKTYGWSPLDLNLLGIYPKPDFVPSLSLIHI